MRVALVTPAFPYPHGGVYVGIERHALGLARHLTAHGHAVTVFTTFWNGGPALETVENIPIHRESDLSDRLGRAAALFDLHYRTWGKRLMLAQQTLYDQDVIHALAPLSSTRALKSRGIPFVTHFYHYESIDRAVDLLFKPFHRQIERRAYRDSTLVLTPSRSSALDLEVRLGIPAAKIRIAPLGFDTAFSVGRPRGLPSGPVRLLFVGEHEDRKGLQFLLKAVQLLRQDRVGVVLRTVGDGSRTRALKALTRRLGIEDLVTFSGYQPDPDGTLLPRAYASADIFVLPSLKEGFGLVLLEAMASGVPVIASDISAIPEVIGDAGVLVPAMDSRALAHAIRSLIQSPARWSELRARGQARVNSLFSWDQVIAKVVAVYNEAIKLAGERLPPDRSP
jgi:glycosyltransferase involved in cell wall biosynthesis